MFNRARGALTWPLLMLPGAHLLRMLSAAETKWRQGEGDPNAMARSTFTAIVEPVSVFLAIGTEQEVEAAAAQWLKRGASPKEPAFALRLSLSDLRGAGVRIEASDGETGIAHVDRRHRDIATNPDAYVKLTRELLAARARGADSIREVPARAIVAQLEKFVLLDGSKIGAAAKRQAQKKLEEWKSRQPKVKN